MSSTPWFIAPPEDWGQSEVRLPEAESHHAVKVLRVAPPDIITITDGRGRIARCSVARVDEGRVVAEVLQAEQATRVKPELVVYQGAGKGGKVDDAIERLAELGVAEVWVYGSERSVARWDDAKLRRLTERWATIGRSAAKQSRSPFVLTARGGLSWTELVRRITNESFAVVLWEGASLPLRAALIEQVERIAVVVGPEGGLTRGEAEALADAGAILASLGPRILRTENAPVVAAAALLYHYGVIG